MAHYIKAPLNRFISDHQTNNIMPKNNSKAVVKGFGYLICGRCVYVHREVEGEGYLVSDVYEVDGFYGDEQPGQEISSTKYIVDRVLPDEPRLAVHASVAKAREDLEALGSQMAALNKSISEAKAMHDRVMAERSLMEGLDTILDYLTGKAMYVAVRGGYPRMWRYFEIEEYLLKKEDYGNKSLRMVSIRLDPNMRNMPRDRSLKDLRLVANSYRDGSGFDEDIQFFKTEGDAIRFVSDMAMKECKESWESKRHVESHLVDVLIEHRADVPQEWIDYLAARMVSMVATEVENMTTNLEAKKVELDKTKAKAYRYRARAMNMPVGDGEEDDTDDGF